MFPKRTPVVLQVEGAECGLACLAMIAGEHGLHLDLVAMRSELAPAGNGMTLKDLLGVAAKLGLTGRAIKVDLESLGRVRTPCILHWDKNHFVVLEGVGRRHVSIIDPAWGRQRLSWAAVSAHYTGIALELWPAPSFRRLDKRRALSMRSLTGHDFPVAKSIATITLFGLALEALALGIPLLSQVVLDRTISQGDVDLLPTIGLAMAFLVVTHAAITVLRSYASLAINNRLIVRWLGNTFEHLIKLPMPYFQRRSTGDVSARFASLGAIRRTLTSSFVDSIIDGIFASLALAVMMWYSVLLATIVVAGFVTYSALKLAFLGPLSRSSTEEITCGSLQHSYLLETISGVSPIKLFGREGQRTNKWLNLLIATLNQETKTQKLTIFLRAFGDIASGLERSLTIVCGAYFVSTGRFSIGMLIAFLAYREQFSPRAAKLLDKLAELRMLHVHKDRLADIVHSEQENPDWKKSSVQAQVRPTIEFRNVWFRYSESGPWILRNASFQIDAGETIALVGPSGCGKSTVIKLLVGFLEPTEGSILVGDVPLPQLGTEALRAMLGVVMQGDTLMTGSIFENISFFETGYDEEEVLRSARSAGICDEISALPMGFNTHVFEGGTTFSGGQSQRILIARAMYRRPAILLLDEATSNLDIANERRVNSSLRNYGATVVLVAHRPETVALATRVIDLGKASADSVNTSEVTAA